jgi:hypothetical protein
MVGKGRYESSPALAINVEAVVLRELSENSLLSLVPLLGLFRALSY